MTKEYMEILSYAKSTHLENTFLWGYFLLISNLKSLPFLQHTCTALVQQSRDFIFYDRDTPI